MSWYVWIQTQVLILVKTVGNQNLYLTRRLKSNFLRSHTSQRRRRSETIYPTQQSMRTRKTLNWNSRALVATRDLRKIYELCSIKIILMTSNQWTLNESVRTRNSIVRPRCWNKDTTSPIGVCTTFITFLNLANTQKLMKIYTGALYHIFAAKVIMKLYRRRKLLPPEECRYHIVKNRIVEEGLSTRLVKWLQLIIIITVRYTIMT